MNIGALFKRRSMPQHLETGAWGEKLAADFLKRKGYRILGCRVRVGTRDEFDIIATHHKSLVFVEVKTRTSETFGRPITAIRQGKRHRMSRAAVRYLKKLKNPRVCFRFDVIEVIGRMHAVEAPIIRHVENAFPLERRYALP